MMRTGTMVALAAVAAAAKPALHELGQYTFEEFARDFNKVYADDIERGLRQKVFESNVERMVQHNAAGRTWTMNVNRFADLTPAEFKKSQRGTSKHVSKMLASTNVDVPSIEALPASVDWRIKGVVSPVKDQGGCGSCWAFGSVETIETHIAMATGKLPILSPQNVVSCSKNPDHCGGTGGCSGSIAELAFEYVKENGISSEIDYPYRGVTGTCKPEKVSATISGYVKLPENNYTAVLGALATVGPMAINVDAEPWQLYSGGVFEPSTYATLDIDHVVQVVGYGSELGKDYWIVRNRCGEDTTPQDGTACTGGPTKITACGTSGILYDVSYPTV